jgi:hypothetical protein
MEEAEEQEQLLVCCIIVMLFCLVGVMCIGQPLTVI